MNGCLCQGGHGAFLSRDGRDVLWPMLKRVAGFRYSDCYENSRRPLEIAATSVYNLFAWATEVCTDIATSGTPSQNVPEYRRPRMWVNNVLHLPNLFWQTYERQLLRLGILDECRRGTDTHRLHGGPSEQEVKDHFAYRFGNSASRICYVLEDPQRHFAAASADIAATFAMGDISLLDLVGGSGAAVVTLLTHIYDQRREYVDNPSLPLTIRITAADYSQHALNVYREMVEVLIPQLEQVGVTVSITTEIWDGTRVDQTSALCDRWLGRSADSNELFVCVCNLSGIGASRLDQFARPLQHVTERIANYPSTFVWLEPGAPSGQRFLAKAKKIIFQVANWFTESTQGRDSDSPGMPNASYHWKHEIQESRNLIKSDVSILRYRRNPGSP